MDHEAQVSLIVGLAVLLGLARIGGELARALKSPGVVGELVVGVLLGPTVLGTLAPSVTEWLFPTSGMPRATLDGIRLVSVCFLTLVAGLEIELSMLRRVGRSALVTAAGGLLVPFAVGFVLTFELPWLAGGQVGSASVAFPLVFGAAMAISALGTIARILLDLDLLRTELGLLVMCSAMLDDLFGWLAFSVALSMAMPGVGARPVDVLLETLAFAAFALVLLRPLLDRALPWLQSSPRGPTAALAPILVLGLLGGAVTQALGTHVAIGAFLVGVAIRTQNLRGHVHETVRQVVMNVFAPIYFATVGLRINFLESFSPGLTLVVILIACTGKLVGAAGGARLAGYPLSTALCVSVGLNARGSQEIVLAELALQFGIIDKSLFTAIVLMALVTATLSGPLMELCLRFSSHRPTLADMVGDRIVSPLHSRSAFDAISELAGVLAPSAGIAPAVIAHAAQERQRIFPAGVGKEIAIPFVVLETPVPVVALGVSPTGIDFNARDELPARLIFLIVAARKDSQLVLQMSRQVAGMLRSDAALRSRLVEAEDVAAIRTALESASRPAIARPMPEERVTSPVGSEHSKI